MHMYTCTEWTLHQNHQTSNTCVPEIISHSIFPSGVIETHLDVHVTVQTKGFHLTRHLTVTRHSEGHFTNKLLGYFDDPIGKSET